MHSHSLLREYNYNATYYIIAFTIIIIMMVVVVMMMMILHAISISIYDPDGENRFTALAGAMLCQCAPTQLRFNCMQIHIRQKQRHC